MSETKGEAEKVFNDDDSKSGQFLFRNCSHQSSLWLCEHCVAAALREVQNERDKYEKDAIYHRVKVEDLKDERDAAYVRGLERAVEIILGCGVFVNGKLIDAIQSEIEQVQVEK